MNLKSILLHLAFLWKTFLWAILKVKCEESELFSLCRRCASFGFQFTTCTYAFLMNCTIISLFSNHFDLHPVAFWMNHHEDLRRKMRGKLTFCSLESPQTAKHLLMGSKVQVWIYREQGCTGWFVKIIWGFSTVFTPQFGLKPKGHTVHLNLSRRLHGSFCESVGVISV